MGTILARNKLSKKKITFSAHKICSNYEILLVYSLFPNLVSKLNKWSNLFILNIESHILNIENSRLHFIKEK